MTMESKMIAPQQAGNGGLKHGGPNYQSGAGTGQGPGGPGLAINSIFFCFLFVKTH